MWARKTWLRFCELEGFVLTAWGFRHVSAGLLAVPGQVRELPDPAAHLLMSSSGALEALGYPARFHLPARACHPSPALYTWLPKP